MFLHELHNPLHHEKYPPSPLDFKQKNKYISRLKLYMKTSTDQSISVAEPMKTASTTQAKLNFQSNISSVFFPLFLLSHLTSST